MPHSSREKQHQSWPHRAAPKAWVVALAAEFDLARTWVAARLKVLFANLVREGISPPTTFEGLPPGQFPPIDAIKDELFGRQDRDRRSGAPFDMKATRGPRIERRPGGRELP